MKFRILKYGYTFNFFKTLFQPVYVLFQIFHTINKSSIRSKVKGVHDLPQGHKVTYINTTGVGKGVVGWVKVNHCNLSLIQV